MVSNKRTLHKPSLVTVEVWILQKKLVNFNSIKIMVASKNTHTYPTYVSLQYQDVTTDQSISATN